MTLLPGMTNCGEGNISWFPERMNLLHSLILENKPLNLIETGFNMGHSSLLIGASILQAMDQDSEYSSKKINFYVFDICVHPCVKSNFQIVKEFFQHKINMVFIEGSTHETLKPFLHSNNIYLDFAEIDGDHSYEGVQNDTNAVINRMNPNGIIYIDDYNSSKIPFDSVNRGVNDLIWDAYSTFYIDGVFVGRK